MHEQSESSAPPLLARRFRGFLPVIIDVETAGFEPGKHALLEIAAVPILLDSEGFFRPGATIACHVAPFSGAQFDPKALEFNGIDPHHPFRFAKPEAEALEHIFKPVRLLIKTHHCSRAILVGHNPFFDLSFMKAAIERCKIKKHPFHSFSTFDTATLGGLAYGQTVLARAAIAAGIEWNAAEAHSAIYDAEKTAELFCRIVNKWDQNIGIPLRDDD
ncbi:MAG: ribonuclease T [Gammaproteobacteria bacterium]|jgi:ribonuclease T